MLISSLFRILAFVLHRRSSTVPSYFTLSKPSIVSAQSEVRHD
ncbi:hypothetical protein [Pseudomonas putida]|nr:hypothetical protein [Pseudomonas putida]